MVTPRACGVRSSRILPTVTQDTPFATRRSSSFISGGSCRRNVKIRIASSDGGTTSRIT